MMPSPSTWALKVKGYLLKQKAKWEKKKKIVLILALIQEYHPGTEKKKNRVAKYQIFLSTLAVIKVQRVIVL